VEDNPHTLLDQTDIVFVDPVGTGYSRAARPELGPKFWGLDEDIAAMGEFVRLYLTRYGRWGSPLFLSGESYGTTRAAGLSGYLADRGITFNGVMLISTVLDRQASSTDPGNHIGFVNFLPSYTAAAWYHKRLPADLQAKTVEQVTDEAERWAISDYNVALTKGARLTPEERRRAVQQMARYTGLPEQFIEDNDLKVTLQRFDHELLRPQRLAVGRLDSRFTTFEADPGGERGQFDPSEAAIRNSFTPVFNDYVRRELRYRNDDVYYILGGGIGRWRYPQTQGYSDVSPALERAFARNPYMKLLVAMGYYDTATPYFAVEYTLAQLRVAPEVRKNIVTEYFAAGHMMYIDEPSMTKLRAAMRRFIDGALRQEGAPQTVAGTRDGAGTR
jgi:carboxypeptidase C (cathepsin A)